MPKKANLEDLEELRKRPGEMKIAAAVQSLTLINA